jgi:hypothetical protein
VEEQQDCDWREIKAEKHRYNDTETQNILAKFSEKSSLTLHGETNFSWGKKLYIEWCSIKEEWNSAVASGDVAIGRSTTKLIEESASGDVAIVRSTTKLIEKSASGDVAIGRSTTKLIEKSASGDVAIGRSTTKLIEESASGDVAIGRSTTKLIEESATDVWMKTI